MTTSPGQLSDTSIQSLPADDPLLLTLSMADLVERWAATASRSAFNAEAMTGADRRAQALGVPGIRLMEHAGTAVAAAARALAVQSGTWGRGPVLILAGPGNNGGDGFVAARRLAEIGADVVVVLCAPTPRPSTPDAGRNWDRLASSPGVSRMHAPAARDIELLGRGVAKACVVIDALLGTGVRGELRDPVRAAVILANRARSEGVPILAVDTPTAVDLTSGEALRSGGSSRRHGDLPPAQGRAPAADRPRSRWSCSGGANRDPARGRPWLTVKAGRR